MLSFHPPPTETPTHTPHWSFMASCETSVTAAVLMNCECWDSSPDSYSFYLNVIPLIDINDRFHSFLLILIKLLDSYGKIYKPKIFRSVYDRRRFILCLWSMSGFQLIIPWRLHAFDVIFERQLVAQPVRAPHSGMCRADRRSSSPVLPSTIYLVLHKFALSFSGRTSITA